MTTIQLLPPITVATQTLTVNGRKYSAAPGATLDVNLANSGVLRANGWTEIAEVGATAARPSTPAPGKHFFDTTLAVTVTFDGSKWRDPATGNAV